MAKQDYIFRYLAIIKKLRTSDATFQEIQHHLMQKSGLHDRPFACSSRTFCRDLSEIRQIFRIDIRFDYSRGVYYIAADEQQDLNNRLLESVDTFNSLKMFSDIARYMSFEKRRAYGSHHFQGLIHAIRNRIVLSMTHQRFNEDEPRIRVVEPYALKESKGRWYLLARDRSDRRIKTFGLDRIIDFSDTPSRFDYPANLDINEMFRYSFGVINSDQSEPDEIVLSFLPEQGKYIKSYPLHETQEILTDNAEELRIRLRLYATYDLIMEILSYGSTVKVMAPAGLADRVRTILFQALEQYK